MNEKEINALPFEPDAPKLTPGGGEIVSSEKGFVQTEAEVGAEVLTQEAAAT